MPGYLFFTLILIPITTLLSPTSGISQTALDHDAAPFARPVLQLRSQKSSWSRVPGGSGRAPLKRLILEFDLLEGADTEAFIKQTWDLVILKGGPLDSARGETRRSQLQWSVEVDSDSSATIEFLGLPSAIDALEASVRAQMFRPYFEEKLHAEVEATRLLSYSFAPEVARRLYYQKKVACEPAVISPPNPLPKHRCNQPIDREILAEIRSGILWSNRRFDFPKAWVETPAGRTEWQSAEDWILTEILAREVHSMQIGGPRSGSIAVFGRWVDSAVLSFTEPGARVAND